jgi:hypothetical protein
MASLARHAELAHDEHVERRPEDAGDLEGDGNAAARQAEDHGPGPSMVLEGVAQLATGVDAIDERHRVLPSTSGSCRLGHAGGRAVGRHLEARPRDLRP